jgi:hypothetical protein
VPPTVLSTRPRRVTSREGAIPRYYRNLSGVNFTHIARDPYDDLYGCNMHYAKASSLHGVAITDAAALKEVINIFGVFKAVRPVHADSLSAATLRVVLLFFMFCKAKTLTPAELAAALAAQASHDRMTCHTHDAKSSGKPANFKIKARWVGGGYKQSDLDRSFITAPTARPQSHKIILALTALGKRRLTVADVPSAYLQTQHESPTGTPVYIRVDKEISRIVLLPYPDYKEFLCDGTII